LSGKDLPGTPPPSKPRRARLDTIAGCRRELARLYAEAREGKLEAQTATRLASIVGMVARILDGAELEARVAKLEGELGQAGGPR
jgi:hypothetical protein